MRNSLIVLKAPATYEKQWWTWWKGINPSWHVVKNGQFALGGTGDWTKMLKLGRNRFLLVLMSLVGLQYVATDVSWCEALADVGWVMEQVFASAQMLRNQ